MPDLQLSPDELSGEGERLLSQDDQFTEMRGLDSLRHIPDERGEGGLLEEASQLEPSRTESTFQLAAEANGGPVVAYKVYKRRWFGLAQLILLNIVVSWDVSNRITVQFRTRFNIDSGSPILLSQTQPQPSSPLPLAS